MSRPSNHGHDHIAKRPKLFRACAECVVAKTRCENVLFEGCSVCRRKGKQCSLRGAVSDGASASGHGQGTGAQAPYASAAEGYHDVSRMSRIGSPVSRAPSTDGRLGRDSHTVYAPAGGYVTNSHHANANSNADHHFVSAVPHGLGPYSNDLSPTSALGQTGGDLAIRIAESEARIQSLEKQVVQMKQQQQSTSEAIRPYSAGGVGNVAGEVEEEPEVPLLPIKNRHVEPFSDAILTVIYPSQAPCVISRGLLSEEEVGLAWYSFAHSISRVLPLTSWTKSGDMDSVPNNPRKYPNVVIAMLQHVSPFNRKYAMELAQMTDEFVMMALKGMAKREKDSAVEMVMALLILAIAPLPLDGHGVADSPTTGVRNTGRTGGGRVRTSLSPAKYIALAVQVGRERGLEGDVMQTIRRAGDGIVNPAWRSSYLRLEVWAAVVSRYNLLHIMQTHRPILMRNPIENLASSARTINPEMHAHLDAERMLCTAAWDVLESLIVVEDDLPSAEDARVTMAAWREAFDRLEGFTSGIETKNALVSSRVCLMQSLVIRTAIMIQQIPTPLAPLRNLLLPYMGHIRSCAIATFDLVVPDSHPDPAGSGVGIGISSDSYYPSTSTTAVPVPVPPAPMSLTRLTCPAHVSQAALMACMTVQGTVAHLRAMRLESVISGVVDETKYETVLRLLKEGSGVMRVILDKLERWHEVHIQAALKQHAAVAAAGGGGAQAPGETTGGMGTRNEEASEAGVRVQDDRANHAHAHGLGPGHDGGQYHGQGQGIHGQGQEQIGHALGVNHANGESHGYGSVSQINTNPHTFTTGSHTSTLVAAPMLTPVFDFDLFGWDWSAFPPEWSMDGAGAGSGSA